MILSELEPYFIYQLQQPPLNSFLTIIIIVNLNLTTYLNFNLERKRSVKKREKFFY